MCFRGRCEGADGGFEMRGVGVREEMVGIISSAAPFRVLEGVSGLVCWVSS